MKLREASSILSQNSAHAGANGRFFNPWPGTRPHGLGDFLKWVVQRRGRGQSAGRIRARGGRTPSFPLAVPDVATPRAEPDQIVVTWVGHSSFLLQIGGVNVLLDPIWSERASPFSFAGPKRAVPAAVEFDALPPIDLIVMSHDHYDHLDLATVRRIIRKYPDAEWLAPLRVGGWLLRQGARVAAECDWWQSVRALGLDISCTPAQHFSGRRVNNRNSTLWCGWVIRAGKRAIFYAGDTGRHPEFGAITEKLGPFDAAFLPIGAYEPRWFMQPVHMAPEEAVSAYVDILHANAGQPCTFIAMHWGTFKLTDEALDEPPRLTRAAWRAAEMEDALLWIPRHGETWTCNGKSN